jgi:hypothetical protein
MARRSAWQRILILERGIVGTDSHVDLMMTADSIVIAAFTKQDPKTDATKIYLPVGLN